MATLPSVKMRNFTSLKFENTLRNLFFNLMSTRNNQVEMVFINENPYLPIKDSERPKGKFGPIPMRTGWDKVNYGTGIAYLTGTYLLMIGLGYGGVYGTIRGLQTAPNKFLKVRWNSILNQTTRYGPWAANSLGIMSISIIKLAMGWAIFDNLYEEIRETNDYYNHVAAAFTSGALFKSTAGLKPALLAGSILSGVVLGFAALERFTLKSSKLSFMQKEIA
jgi:import inner membrane translocase subunit TIM23